MSGSAARCPHSVRLDSEIFKDTPWHGTGQEIILLRRGPSTEETRQVQSGCDEPFPSISLLTPATTTALLRSWETSILVQSMRMVCALHVLLR